MQSKYTGNISFYFPCKVKSKGEIERLNKRWVYWQNKKVNNIHHTHSPLTDLMDKEYNRDISENLQCALQKSLGSELTDSDNISPYALKCLQQAYRKNREDNLFAKNVQVLLSKFSISYHIKQKDCDINADGLLFLNVNPDNSIATSILVLHFKDKSAEDIIYLKHVFYKRLLVTLKEYPIESIKEMDCENCKWLDCVVCKSNNINNNVTTIQDYVNRKFD